MFDLSVDFNYENRMGSHLVMQFRHGAYLKFGTLHVKSIFNRCKTNFSVGRSSSVTQKVLNGLSFKVGSLYLKLQGKGFSLKKIVGYDSNFIFEN